jgi:hypothetical protein
MFVRHTRTAAALAHGAGLVCALTGCASEVESAANRVMRDASNGDEERLREAAVEGFDLSAIPRVASMKNQGCDWKTETVTADAVAGAYFCPARHGVTFTFEDGKLSSVKYEEDDDDTGYSTY